jgi:hypothetical protein
MGIILKMKADIRGRTGGYYISPHCPSVLSDNANGQGGQSVHFKQIYCRIIDSLASAAGRVASESIGLTDRLIKEREVKLCN